MGELQKYAVDPEMYTAEPVRGLSVILLNATPDPLGSVAALCKAYKGEVVRSLAEVTDKERRGYFQDMMKTVLNGPLEAAQFHFLLEGVSRALVDQLTRGRSAFYAVESLRFAVKENFADEVPTPPFLAGLPDDDTRVRLWRKALVGTEGMYHALIANGVPAEDARRLLPMGIATRAHWVVDLRELLSVAGKRLCTQAEFEWRLVMTKVVSALREYGRGQEWSSHWWQFGVIAERFQPVCYQTGRCGFMAQFDRGCKIRERVEQNAALGRSSSEWGSPLMGMVPRGGVDGYIARERGEVVAGIDPQEWLLDPEAAR